MPFLFESRKGDASIMNMPAGPKADFGGPKLAQVCPKSTRSWPKVDQKSAERRVKVRQKSAQVQKSAHTKLPHVRSNTHSTTCGLCEQRLSHQLRLMQFAVKMIFMRGPWNTTPTSESMWLRVENQRRCQHYECSLLSKATTSGGYLPCQC